MKLQTIFIPVAVLVAIAWRNPYFIGVLRPTALPEAFYSDGDWKTHCTVIKSPADGVPKFEYCEDAIFWDQLSVAGELTNRLIIISCDPGRKSWNTVMGPLREPEPHGGLWLYQPASVNSESEPSPILFEGYPKGHDFHPLGLDITHSRDGSPSDLFVVNHARARSYIEQFVLDPAEPTVAKWVRTVASTYLVAPNGIALTSPTSFYVSNDHLMTRRLPKPLGSILPMMETLLSLPTTWISHITLDESTHSKAEPAFTIDHSFAALGLSFANGIALSPNGRTLAIASSSMMQVHLYDRNPTTNALAFAHTVHVPFAPDNLSYDDEGTLFAAGHPHFPSVIAIAKGQAGAVAPSWVVSISPRVAVHSEATVNLKEYDTRAPVSASAKVPAVLSHVVETTFQSNGTMFGTSTTGLRDSTTGVQYVVGLYDQGMLICKP
ncbi:hypothetical protein FIBSPDRAFT_822904 [Athelia psychrophila]|uniref:Calcium-dependent phosphotriesterase n=1 Tax=Athelia psychrophila TaxID=1759441 RepID=A0A166M9N3_9AGAM|nr:hypothetical protein FIBSPDRAFT_822904 [Fibularhizoctonia sp. CBS 109695]